MTPRISKLVLAAVLASTIPAAAAASDCDHPDGRAGVVYPAPWQSPPGPAPRVGWRGHELASVRAELQALEAERAQFHARFASRPGKLRKYDCSYFERRAALERRWHELQRVAYR